MTLPEYGQNIVRAVIIGVTSVLITDADGNSIIVATDALHPNLGVPIMGRFGTVDLNVGEGDAVPIRTNNDGEIILSANVVGAFTGLDDDGNTGTQGRVDNEGYLYGRAIGQERAKGNPLILPLSLPGDITTAVAITSLDYLTDLVTVTFDNRNTDPEGLIGDSLIQPNAVAKGLVVPLGAVDPRTVFVRAHTAVTDDAAALLTLTDRPDYRQFVLEDVRSDDGAYWPFEERSGTDLNDLGKDDNDLLLSGANLGDAGVFGLGINFDGVVDFLRQASEAVNAGTVTGVETDGSAALDDDSAPFTAAIRDGNHWVRIVDNGGDIVHAYVGPADPDGDDTRVQLFNTTARSTQNLVEGGATAFDFADTPVTFIVFKELARASSDLTIGAWIDTDVLPSPGDNMIIANHDAGASSVQAGVALLLSSGFARFFVNAGVVNVTATSTTPLRTGQQFFIVGVFESSTSVTLYVNGVQDTQTVAGVPAAINQIRDPWQIGAHRVLNTAAAFFNGRVSHPFIIEGAMNANWVRTAYELSRRG